jgi:hypothetical protein
VLNYFARKNKVLGVSTHFEAKSKIKNKMKLKKSIKLDIYFANLLRGLEFKSFFLLSYFLENFMQLYVIT